MFFRVTVELLTRGPLAPVWPLQLISVNFANHAEIGRVADAEIGMENWTGLVPRIKSDQLWDSLGQFGITGFRLSCCGKCKERDDRFFSRTGSLFGGRIA